MIKTAKETLGALVHLAIRVSMLAMGAVVAWMVLRLLVACGSGVYRLVGS